MRVRYANLRWTITCKGAQTVLPVDGPQGLAEAERRAVSARLQAHAADCLHRAAHTHLCTELGRLGDFSYRITVEQVFAREARLLIEVWYGARDWSQVGRRVFWWPTRGWPRLAGILQDARSTFLQGMGALCNGDGREGRKAIS